jgi:glycosyltransferase involved in cell wall biosynthesis
MLAIAQGSDVHRYLDMPMRRRAILRLAERAQIATRSADLRQRLLKAGAVPGRVHTVYNGVDTATFHPGDKTAARRALQLPETGGIALFVGNFLPVKGIDLLVRALGRARDRVPGGARLVLIGSGPLEKELEALARSCGLDVDHFRLAGRRPPAEVAQFMRAADVVCLSSHNEGVPNVVLEALASGRPIVSTDVGGIAEVLRDHEDAGKLLPNREVEAYASALATLLSNPPDQLQVAAHAAPYTWPRCAEICWELVTNNADLLYAKE